MDTPHTHPQHQNYADEEPRLSQIESIVWERLSFSAEAVADLDEAIRVMVSGMLSRWGIAVDRRDIEIRISCRRSVENITLNGRPRKRLNFHNIAAHTATKDTFISTSSTLPHDHMVFMRGATHTGNYFSMSIVQDYDKGRFVSDKD